MRRRHGFAELGPADGAVKRAIFAGNSTRLHDLATAIAAASGTRYTSTDECIAPAVICAATRRTATSASEGDGARSHL
jgi:hypothetical protein